MTIQRNKNRHNTNITYDKRKESRYNISNIAYCMVNSNMIVIEIKRDRNRLA